VAWWPFGKKETQDVGTGRGPRRSSVPKIFICYRRSDSSAYAGRIFDRLSATLGGQNIFMDIDTIAPGVNFADSIRQEIGYSDVILVIIGPTWLEARNENGQSRLDDPNDFVRIEIETAWPF
jgi:hypothetical protein